MKRNQFYCIFQRSIFQLCAFFPTINCCTWRNTAQSMHNFRKTLVSYVIKRGNHQWMILKYIIICTVTNFVGFSMEIEIEIECQHISVQIKSTCKSNHSNKQTPFVLHLNSFISFYRHDILLFWLCNHFIWYRVSVGVFSPLFLFILCTIWLGRKLCACAERCCKMVGIKLLV